MIILNFSHPLSEEQIHAVETLAEQPIEQLFDITCDLDHCRPFTDQIEGLIRSIPLSTGDWQSKPILVNLPSLNYAAAVLLAQLHGLMGYFPPCIRMRPEQAGVMRKFGLAEIINLQVVRDAARSWRATRKRTFPHL